MEVAWFILLAAPPMLLGITLHEVAHGWVAYKCGDPTAKSMGRLTLNPLKHIDPVGTILVPLTLAFIVALLKVGIPIGWAKPVPIQPSRLRNQRRDMILVAIAGPAANLAMAAAWGLLLALGGSLGLRLGGNGSWVLEMASIGLIFNTVLLVLNLIPLPPLDGGQVLRQLLPAGLRTRVDAFARFGLIIAVLLVATGMLAPVFVPLVRYLQLLALKLAGS